MNNYDLEDANHTLDDELDAIQQENAIARQIVLDTHETLDRLNHLLNKFWATADQQGRGELTTIWNELNTLASHVMLADNARQHAYETVDAVNDARIDNARKLDELIRAIETFDTMNPHVEVLYDTILESESEYLDEMHADSVIDSLATNHDLSWRDARNLYDALVVGQLYRRDDIERIIQIMENMLDEL